MQSAQNRKQSETGGLALQLKLKIDARVMLTMNVDIEDRLINGQVGTVNHFRKNQHNQITIVYVKFDDEKAGVKKMNSDHFAKTNKCVPIEKSETSINLQRNRPLSPAIHRTQFPLMLSWACTVHKVQSLSLEKAVISFDLLRQKAFNPGQMYVALSRVTNIDGLYLIGKYSRSSIKTNTDAAK